MQQQQPCPFCGQLAGYVFVHGHYQCASCGQNVIPCCDGPGRFAHSLLNSLQKRLG